MAHGELAQGMAYGGHILLGNHEIARTNGSTPIIGFYPVQTRHVEKLDPMVESRPEQRLCHQQNTTSQGMHQRRSYPPPCGIIASDRKAARTQDPTLHDEQDLWT